MPGSPGQYLGSFHGMSSGNKMNLKGSRLAFCLMQEYRTMVTVLINWIKKHPGSTINRSVTDQHGRAFQHMFPKCGFFWKIRLKFLGGSSDFVVKHQINISGWDL